MNVRSNLDTYESINIESTSKLFLGNNASHKWLDQTFKSILSRELEFIDEVLQSEEKPCRFAYLQKASIYKLILQLGTNTQEYEKIIKSGMNSLKAI